MYTLELSYIEQGSDGYAFGAYTQSAHLFGFEREPLSFTFDYVEGGRENALGFQEVELSIAQNWQTADPGWSSLMAWIPGADHTYIFRINFSDGTHLDLLQLDDDAYFGASTSGFMMIGGNAPVRLSSGQEWAAAIEAIELSDLFNGNDPVFEAIEAGTLFTPTDFMQIRFDPEGAYRDPEGRSTSLALSDSGYEVHMGEGLDTVYGGAGDDWISSAGYSLQADLGFPSGNNIRGGDGDDTLKFVSSGSGILKGEDGNDRLLGGWFADILEGGAGADFLFGGTGDDFLRDDYGTWGVPTTDNDSLYGGDGDDWIHIRSGGSDVLRGNAGNDELVINGDGDQIRAYGDDDDDAFHLWAGGGFASGGSGNDHFTIYQYTDFRLHGGTGADTFLFSRVVEGFARILDFEAGTDALHLSEFDGISNMNDLTLTQKSWGVRIDVADGVIALHDVALDDLSASDFDFF